MSHPHILYLVPTGKRRHDRDSGTVTSIVSLSGEETNIRVTSGVVKSVALPEATVDLYTPVIEAATVASIVVLLPDGQGDERDYPDDADIVTSVADVSLSVFVVTYVAEDTVITSISQISSSDTHGSVVGTNYIDAATLTVVASISATVIHTTPNDAATITGVSIPTAAEVMTYVSESSVVTGIANFLTVEQMIFIDPAPNLTNIVTTVASILTVVETVAWNPDANTITSIGVPVTISGDLEASIDASTYLVPSTSLLSSPLQTLREPIISTAVLTGLENQAFSADADTIVSVATVITTNELGPVRVDVPIATIAASALVPSVIPPIRPSSAVASTPVLLLSSTLLPNTGLLLLYGIPIPTVQVKVVAPAATATASAPAVSPYISLFPPVSTASADLSLIVPGVRLTVPPAAMTASASSIAPSVAGGLTLANTFEGGSNGTTITTGNSGGTSGNAFDSTSGTVPIFSTTQAMHGTLALAMQGAGNVRWSSTSVTGGNTTIYGRVYVFITAAPNVQTVLVGGQTPSSTIAAQFSVRINTNRAVGTIAKGSTAVASTTTLTAATWYRLEFKMVAVTSGNCTVDCRIYVGDSTTITETMTQATGTGQAGDTAIDGFMIGSTNIVTANVVFLDDLQVNSSGYPGHS